MIQQILLILKALLEAIPVLSRLLKKPTELKNEEAKKENQKVVDKIKETGRPTWED
jgi:hypothetical protein